MTPESIQALLEKAIAARELLFDVGHKTAFRLFNGQAKAMELLLRLPQLRAILAVKPLSSLKIMLPMVSDLAEISATRALLDRLAAEMGISERVELGVMIETPAAAISIRIAQLYA